MSEIWLDGEFIDVEATIAQLKAERDAVSQSRDHYKRLWFETTDEARIRADEREAILAIIERGEDYDEIIAAIRARRGERPERLKGATEVEPGVYVANESLSLWPKVKP